MKNDGRLFIVRGKATAAALGGMILAAHEKIDRFLDRHPAPFIATIRKATARGGEVRVVVEPQLDASRWNARKRRPK